eukprot:12883959-Prorocentrum_lima.AAC.1
MVREDPGPSDTAVQSEGVTDSGTGTGSTSAETLPLTVDEATNQLSEATRSAHERGPWVGRSGN